MLIFAAWMLAALAMGLVASRAAGTRAAGLLAALLLMTHPLLLGQAGMLVTNNFLPLLFAVSATGLFIAGLDRREPAPWLIASAGLCVSIAIGFKANYIFLVPPFAVAAFLVPSRLPISLRVRTIVLPLLIGGVVGGLPSLYYLGRDPAGFLAHVIGYHRGPHIAYWIANSEVDGTKIMTFPGKAGLAAKLWLSGGGFVVLTGVLWSIWANWRGARDAARGADRPLWPILLVTALAVGGALISFVPTPAFPQYYVPPVPFVLLLAALLYGRLLRDQRKRAAPWFTGAALLVILAGAPRLMVGLPQLFSPQKWTGFQIHAAGERVARALAESGARGPVATLAPLYPLEGGLGVYPELAAGPMIYRVGDLIPQADRVHYRMISPTLLPGLLAARPPAAILTGVEGRLDDPFTDYARGHNYRLISQPIVRDRYGEARLYVKP
ncbi:hypothetical protein C1T17_04005 [Sphingobium sp. SCG-1]|nr:hypothetical protein C1T17_04005 [Sphingobium sp. SCG-1]